MEFNTEIIRSRQNRTVVEVMKLSDRKAREEQHRFRFDGLKLFGEAVRNKLDLETVFLRASDAEALQAEAEKRYGASAFGGNGRVYLLADDLFERISEEKSPEGIICTAKYIDKFQKNITIYNSAFFSDFADERIVLLEAVRDPVNIGAVIRSAAALGIDRLIVSADCADIYHPKAVRASMGALFNQKIERADDLPGAIKALRSCGRRVFAAALREDALPLGAFPVKKGDCVAIGNEGHGLSEAAISACNGSVMIPMSGRTESFNAAVAASILMWEFAKGTV